MSEISPDAVEALRDFVNVFEKNYRIDPQQGRISLVSVFATCFGKLTPEDRIKSLNAIFAIAEDINVVLFEDGQDFIAYLKEKSAERKDKHEIGGE